MSRSNLLKFPKIWRGERNKRFFIARPVISNDKIVRRCLNCNRKTRRSWRTGILHNRCFTCRYLVMIYGTNIKVEYRED